MTTSDLHIRDLDTPCLVLDLDTLERNITKMQATAKAAGKQLRPHAKTHKCSALACEQIAAGAAGVCAAKLSEAEALIAEGLDNILITGPVVGDKKVGRLAALVEKASSLMVVVDSAENIDRLNGVLSVKNISMDVLLDLDVGLHRTGTRIEGGLTLAHHINGCSNLCLRGIQAYAGQVQHIRSYSERKRASLESLQGAVDIFTKLQQSIPTVTIFSTSGTGTYDIDTEIPEITELQAGSYVFMDAEYRHIGSAGNAETFVDFDPALKLLTTVVSANQAEFVTVDAGLKALYQHGAVPIVAEPAGGDLEYDWFGDEYGKITGRNGAALPALQSVLQIIVSHCDPTVNLFDEYFLVRGETVAGKWSIDLRGCCR
jgi:D-serine deaminase-like pyridoxal phosphate-dependent protein